MYTYVHTHAYARTACKVLSHLEVVQGTPLYGFHAQPEVHTHMKRVAQPQSHPQDSMWLRVLTCSIRPAFLSIHPPNDTPQLFIRVSLFDPRHVARLVKILETGAHFVCYWHLASRLSRTSPRSFC